MSEILNSFGLPIVMIGLVIAAAATFVMFARNYRKCPPNQVLVVYGRKHKDGAGYRLITGGSAFVYPLFESFTTIQLDTFSVESSVTKTPNKDGVPVNVDATANVKVSSKPTLLSAAVERMLGKTREQIHAMLKTTLDGLLRQIIGTLTVEEIIQDRERLATQVLSGATTELNKLGFEIDVFVVNKVSDEEGYIEALGTKRAAEVKRDAKIAQAEAERESTVKSSAARQEGETARLAAEEGIAVSNQKLSLKQATIKQEVETANAVAEMAGPLKKAEIDKQLRQLNVQAEEGETTARIGLAQKEAERIEQELVYKVIRPAEAQAKAATITAEGNANSTIKQAEGAATAAVKQAEAAVATAGATKTRLTLEGEGQAAAEAARQRAMGLATAEVARATGEAEGAAIRARGEAEGAATAARLKGEAEGLSEKNKALANMGEGARFIILLDHLPEIITHLGDAGQKVVGSAFDGVGQGLSRIDNINIVDMGGGQKGEGGDAVSRFALTIPKTVFGILAQAKAAGIDLPSILENVGFPKGSLDGLLSQLKVGSGTTVPAPAPADESASH